MGLIGDEWKQGWGPLPGGRYSCPTPIVTAVP